jgi:flagellar protein FliS
MHTLNMSAQNSQYLESKVLTAPPHRLHLMLIEGAIRFGRQAEELLRQGETLAAARPLLRVVDIVGEMLAAVRERKTDINKKLTELYWYLFRRVSEAKLNSDSEKLAEALSLLEFERQTWLAVCERLGSSTSPAVSLQETAAPSTLGLSLEA